MRIDVSHLIDGLSDPEAYPDAVKSVEVKQTHISAVFLVGDFVYKIKKPVALGFLDFKTLENRLHFCREEVRLNRLVAPGVCLEVVSVVEGTDGLRVEGEGEAVEWAVKMRRLPDEATLLHLVKNGSADSRMLEKVACRIAAFHREAETS